ncbi:MAG: tRNA (adenosine(37)-N6)-dimethylallyltransferase MiaA [Flavobacteriales bacterium]|jgi:tRNA dimethylallyltransferase|nr:tRNA (adenosine(37)-N6)-dimethylallyltransferase MiaA [Flavobacteriales bacterium]
MEKKKTLIVIVGPTAIGKTALAIELARYFSCEIISADSRQFFKEMAIGTAKPTPEELASAPHHFVDFLSITEKYTAGQFEKDAIQKLDELYQKNDIAVLVGGSGLYVDAVCYGIDEIPSNEEIRTQLNKELELHGLTPLQEELKEVDPKIWETINQKNPQRIIRALEVFRHTGKPYSFFRKGTKKNRAFETIKIGLDTDRSIVYDRINQRVDLMLENGLLSEVKALVPYQDLNALNTVGYKEYFKYFKREITLDEATALLKKNTRNFAKRQLTWFRKDQTTKWFLPKDFDAIKSYILDQTTN